MNQFCTVHVYGGLLASINICLFSIVLSVQGDPLTVWKAKESRLTQNYTTTNCISAAINFFANFSFPCNPNNNSDICSSIIQLNSSSNDVLHSIICDDHPSETFQWLDTKIQLRLSFTKEDEDNYYYVENLDVTIFRGSPLLTNFTQKERAPEIVFNATSIDKALFAAPLGYQYICRTTSHLRLSNGNQLFKAASVVLTFTDVEIHAFKLGQYKKMFQGPFYCTGDLKPRVTSGALVLAAVIAVIMVAAVLGFLVTKVRKTSGQYANVE